MCRFICYLFVGLSLLVMGHRIEAQDFTLETGKSVERAIAGGESHTYQIPLTADQFVRLRVDQKVLDTTLILTGPDGKRSRLSAPAFPSV